MCIRDSWYTGYVEPDGKTVFDDRTIAFNGNFLPFNDLTGATEAPRGCLLYTSYFRRLPPKIGGWFDFFFTGGVRPTGRRTTPIAN